MDIITYALCKKLVAGVAGGISGYKVDGLTLKITTSDGEVLEMTFPEPEDGVSITDVKINESNHLICSMSDGNEVDAGLIKTIQGPKGDPGKSGVYLGSEEPQDTDINVWIDPNGNAGVTANNIIFEDAESLQDKYNNGDLKGPKGDTGALKYFIVDELPSENIDESAMYLVPTDNPTEKNQDDTYMYVNGK